MACFTVSAFAGLGVAIARHSVKHVEKKKNIEPKRDKFGTDAKWSIKLSYLELALFGGSFILALEHIIHKEIVFYPPFLSALSSPEDTQTMWQEISTIGVAMFAILVISWAIGVFVYDYVSYKSRTNKNAVSIGE